MTATITPREPHQYPRMPESPPTDCRRCGATLVPMLSATTWRWFMAAVNPDRTFTVHTCPPSRPGAYEPADRAASQSAVRDAIAAAKARFKRGTS